ncbi:50S ribosomal protein L11 methyltransferase [Psittacicella melopsittaci]|uniref:Ribosomal protein L11 methyltransferase n=1 Tax=Psittacicella melopsittaci TaxID=2028576 RepID=A0A3A1Y4U0_9GAMM|nr:50S ribosomal protein L11 methyltransferase [Psittacicella melopsittaci]RIY31177.1 50S ribosomal protein L11 methyltransferase [Psittacicella melopsittaci]
MSWIQITVKLHLADDKYAERIASELDNYGAISTTFMDNQDDPIFEPELNKIELWPNTNVVALFENDVDAQQIIDNLKTYLKVTELDYEVEVIEDQDWVRVWMDQFHPMKFGEKLWICPSNQQVDEEGAVVVDLDPGLAFGTGTHPTTRMCLQYLDSLAVTNALQDKVIIDYGCGSGILGIAAVKLGAKMAYCVDIDPQAIEATVSNAKNNQVSDKIKPFLVEDFAKENILGDITLANILAGPLVELAPTLAQLTKKDGLLALSGILDIKEKDIVTAYSPNFNIDAIAHDEEWIRVTGKKK